MSYPHNPLPGVAAFISVSPAAPSIRLGGNTLQFTASLTDAYGAAVSATQPFTWASSNTALLSVSSSGLCTTASPDVTELNPGSTRVDVQVSYPFCNRTTGEIIYATAKVTVTSEGGKTQFTLRTQDKRAGDSAYSQYPQATVRPASAAAATYPSNWIIENN